MQANEITMALRKILNFENILRAMPQTEVPITHVFADGLYSRGITIPKGNAISGRIHRNSDLNIVVYGAMTVLTEHGLRMVYGGEEFQGKAGLKQVGYAHENTRWITVHATHLTDLREIEAAIFMDEGVPILHDFITGKINMDRSDYFQMLAEVGYTPEQASIEARGEMDRIDLDLACALVELKKSPIEGLGLFAKSGYRAGETIGPARIDGLRTQLGRYTNHSANPNTDVILEDNGNLIWVAKKQIRFGEEITIDYRQSFRLARLEAPCLPQ